MAEKNEIQLSSENIKVTPYGLEFPGTPSLKEWKQAMLGLQKAATKLQFYLGDLFLYAESAVTGWGKVTYQDLVDHSGYDYQSLRDFVWVSRRFTPEFRKALSDQSDICTWTHYRKVSVLDDDQEAFNLLKLSSKSGWSCERLAEEVKKLRGGNRLTDDSEKEAFFNFRITRNEAKFIMDFLTEEFPEDPQANSLCGRLGKLIEE